MVGTQETRASTTARRVSALLEDFRAPRLAATLAVGLVMALINALLGVALMSLIFSGSLTEALPVGIGVGLIASAAVALVLALSSGFPGMYAGIQDNSAAILGLAAASVATSVVAPESVDTVVAMMMTTSFATGTLFILMGRFRLGEIARFVPFPVVGGLLAGTGYLIVVGSLGILGAGWPLSEMTTQTSLGLVWPGLALAGLFLVASLRHWPSKTYLWILVGGIVAFHAATLLARIAQDESHARGWLLGPFPEGGLWPGLAADALIQADWGAIAGEIPSIVTILLLVPVTLLLYISALEISTNIDVDLNGELRATGWANLASGALGGPPGYPYLSITVTAHRLVGGRRGPAVVAAGGMLSIVVVGSSVLELLPQFVIGGLLLFVGIDFLIEWLWKTRRRMSRLDYTLTVGIVVTIAAIGFLPGVAAGLGAAIVLFVYRYSRTDVVKHLLTAREHQSNIERPLEQAEYLYRVGEAVLVLELQGFIFFGTANQIVDRLKTRLERQAPLRHVVFDFRLVSGVDSSAVALFERIALLARDNRFNLVLTNLKPATREQFADFLGSYADVVAVEPDLDHGMAWCEDRLLAELSSNGRPARSFPVGLTERLGAHLQNRTVPEGTQLMRQGDPTPGMYLITSGRATVLLEEQDGQQVRLRTLHEGTVLGEIGLYRREPCTATVVTDTRCDVLHLTPEAFDHLCEADPGAAAELHAFVARILAARVTHANRTIRALHE